MIQWVSIAIAEHFNSPSDLLEVYLTLISRDIEGESADHDTIDDDDLDAIEMQLTQLQLQE